MSRVLIVQQPVRRAADGSEAPAFDFSPAKRFGTLEILAPNGKHILTPLAFIDFLAQRLDGFEPDHDYILPAGDYSVLLVVGMAIGRRFKYAQVLRWISSAKTYEPLLFDFRR